MDAYLFCIDRSYWNHRLCGFLDILNFIECVFSLFLQSFVKQGSQKLSLGRSGVY
jgi:hypothetical protein